ncbi:MAG: hypothetical protein MI974_16795 [Chitinophagales bacterium]|nr:hypothetical protein [Chitinophagales bacterium]
MKVYVKLGILAIGVLLVACNQESPCGEDKATFLKSYYDLIDQVSISKMAANDGKWAGYDEQFRASIEECYQTYESEMTKGERRKFWAKSMRYYYHRYGGSVLEVVKDESNQLSRKISEEVYRRWDRPSDALEEALINTGKRHKNQVENQE